MKVSKNRKTGLKTVFNNWKPVFSYQQLKIGFQLLKTVCQKTGFNIPILSCRLNDVNGDPLVFENRQPTGPYSHFVYIMYEQLLMSKHEHFNQMRVKHWTNPDRHFIRYL